MYSYWLKPDPFARYRKSHQVARWHLILYIIIIGEHVCPGSVLAPWHLLGEGSESMCVCVCECFECHDALHVGNFLVSCIPIGSSPIHSPVTGNHTKWPGGI